MSLAALGLWALVLLLAHLEITVRRPDRPLLTYDSAEYAIAGRHLARTGTLATWFVHPDELATPRRPPFPMIVGHPLVPMLNAAVFTVGGTGTVATLIPPALCFLVLVGCAAALGRRLGDSAAAGIFAGLAVSLSAPVLAFSSEGLSEIPFTAAWMGALVLLWDLPNRPRALVLGFVLGIAHLARPIMVPMLPAWLLGIALAAAPKSRMRTVGLTLVGFIACAAPLALYKWVAAGNPLADVARYNLLSYLSPELTPVRIHRMIHPPSPLPYLLAHPEALVAKFAYFAPRTAWWAIGQAGFAFAALFLAWVARSLRESKEGPFRLTVIATFALYIVLVTLTLPNWRYLFPLGPVLLVIAVSQAWLIGRYFRWPGWLTAVACAALVAFGPGNSLLRVWRTTAPDRGGFTQADWRTIGRELSARLPAKAAFASDVGPELTWYTEHASVLIPNTPEEIGDIDRRLPIQAIVLTNHWLIGQLGSEGWRAMFFGRYDLPGWAPTDSAVSGRLKAIVFTRTRAAADSSPAAIGVSSASSTP